MTDLDFFKLTPAAEKLLLELARRAPDEQLHVVAYTPPQSAGEGVTHVGLERGLASPALQELYSSGEEGGVVIVPDFSASFPADLAERFQPQWSEVSRWQMEEFLIAKLLPAQRAASRSGSRGSWSSSTSLHPFEALPRKCDGEPGTMAVNGESSSSTPNRAMGPGRTVACESTSPGIPSGPRS